MYGSFNESAQEFWDFTRCQRPDGTHYGTGGKCRKGTEAPYADWETLAQGNYGKVSKSPDGERVVKELLERDGVKGEFGPHERQLAIRMGKLGHSPRIHSVSANHIEMDLAPGEPLWKSYAPTEGEGPMTAKQASKAASAVKALHRMGFYHGDAHALQWMVDGDNVKLVDYGLSGKTADRPEKALQDLSKWAKIIGWRNKELAGDPYFELVNRTMDEYSSIKGQSKKAKADRLALAERYLEEVGKL
jgi:tRNA A-37 threonylcarbamoyl transferase component Bud32